MSCIILIGSAPHKIQVGWYAGDGTGMRCLKHFHGKAQIMTLADLSHEGYDKDHPDLWCSKCAQYRGRKAGHEYVVQKSDAGGYEVLDLTYPGGLVVFRAYLYDLCLQWVNHV